MSNQASPALWYAAMQEKDSLTRHRSETELQHEMAVFLVASNSCVWILDWVMRQPVNDEAEKAKLAFGTHAYNLMWSAWNSMLCGRYDVALHSTRSIEECMDFVLAIVAEPSLVEKLSGGKLEIGDARRKIKLELERLREGAGEQWEKKIKGHWIQHKFAHATLPAIRSTVTIETPERVLISPGGGLIDIFKLRSIAVVLAEVVLDLTRTLAVGFQTEVDISSWWTAEGDAFNQTARAQLTSIAKELGFDKNLLETSVPEGTD